MRYETLRTNGWLAAPITAALLGAGCARSPGGSALRASTAAPAPVARVAVVVPERSTVRRVSEQPGQIEAAAVTPLHAKLAGYIGRVTVDIGDRVEAGQVLAELLVPEVGAEARGKRATVAQAEAEKRLAEAEVAVARSGVSSAEAKVGEARAGTSRAAADVGRWEAEYARIDQLFRERAQTGSLRDETRNKLDASRATRDEVEATVGSALAALAEAKATAEKAVAAVEAASARVEVARFEAEQADATAGYARIVAPYDGVVTRRSAEVGQLTTPGTTGMPLFVVASTGHVTISVGVPEADAPFVGAGDPASVRLLALDGRAFEGKVSRTAWALDTATRTLLAEIDLPDADGLLRPGLYAYATIVAESHDDVLTVPSTAIVKDGAANFVVAVVDGKANRRKVEVGLVDGKRTEILSGVETTDRLVEANAAGLKEGQPVEVTPAAGPAAKPKG